MPYLQVFNDFWKQVLESLEKENFAKLTMAKTIGKPDLRNIFVRPVAFDDEVKVLVKFRYKSREVEDIEKETSLGETLEIIQSHLQNPFWNVVLFTTEKDITFKINKKGMGSIVEGTPTFSDVILAEKDLD